MSAARQGNALIRARLEVRSPDGSKRVLQLQIKERRTPTATDLAYLVQWPKERKGEAGDLASGLGWRAARHRYCGARFGSRA